MLTSPSVTPAVLTSWKEIALYLRRGVRTVQRWEQDFGLPVRRARSSDKRAVLARPQDLDSWMSIRNGRPDEGDSQPPISIVELRARLAADVVTSRLLRDNARELRREFRSSLVILSDQLTAMSKKVA